LIKLYHDWGYRLYRVRGFSVNGQYRYYLVFKKGDMAEKTLLGKTRDDFVAKYDEWKAGGYYLYWLDTFGHSIRHWCTCNSRWSTGGR
jgi:hypothetical protein